MRVTAVCATGAEYVMGKKERGGEGGRAGWQIHTTSILDSARVSGAQGGPGGKGRLLWSVESLNGHSNISIFVSAFTLACALSVKDGRKADV